MEKQTRDVRWWGVGNACEWTGMEGKKGGTVGAVTG